MITLTEPTVLWILCLPLNETIVLCSPGTRECEGANRVMQRTHRSLARPSSRSSSKRCRTVGCVRIVVTRESSVGPALKSNHVCTNGA